VLLPAEIWLDQSQIAAAVEKHICKTVWVIIVSYLAGTNRFTLTISIFNSLIFCNSHWGRRTMLKERSLGESLVSDSQSEILS